jgi:hypothetical protein
VRDSSAINAALNELYLGQALYEHAAHLTGTARLTHLQEAMTSCRGALAVITPEMPGELNQLATRILQQAEAALRAEKLSSIS